MSTSQRSLKPEPITEEMGIHEEWYTQAKQQTFETLPAFLKHLEEDYRHDYGTVCHAMAAAALGATWAMDHAPGGGITGFQAGAVMWQFIHHWMGDNGPMRLVKFDEMLYPQHAARFDKVISKNTFKYLQEEAAKKLVQPDPQTHPAVLAHWQSIANGVVPFGYKIEE